MTSNSGYEIIEGISKDWIILEFATSLHIRECLLPGATTHFDYSK